MCKRWTIYDDINAGVDDYADYFAEQKEERGEPLTDNEKLEIYWDELNMWYDAEQANLNKRIGADIVALADIGTWRGRFAGYKLIGDNLADILRTGCDYSAWYYDGHNVRGEMVHHDGRNHILYRAFRDGVTDEQRARFLAAVYDGNADERMIRRYTRSIAPEVCEIFGWPLPASGRKSEQRAA